MRPFKFDKLSAVNTPTVEQKKTLIYYVFILMFFGKIPISVVTRSSSSETKPWPLLLFLMFLLGVSRVIVELMLDVGLVIEL